MLATIKQFFSLELSIEEDHNPQQQLQLAAAALLIELTRADFQQDIEEQKAVESALQSCFKLESQQLQQLIALAEEENKQATSLYQFTRLIADNYNPEQRYTLIKMLWQVAIADGEISKYEDHMIRKISDLIYVSHSQFIKAKLEALEESK